LTYSNTQLFIAGKWRPARSGKVIEVINPFGPLALISRFSSLDEVVEEPNRLPFGLASHAFTRSTKTATAIGAQVEAGMMPEPAFGVVKDSCYGSEGGTEAMEGYFNTKFITQTGV
jgi:succinate-semialdehyde dehydrogenase/glutarate-semialdehyde dehydrogenase